MIGLQNVVLKRITSSTCDIKGDLRGIEWGEEMEHDNPISIHGKGPTLAKVAVQSEGGHWPVPEGTILAPLWKRISAYMLDTVVVMGVLIIATGSWIAYAWNLDALFSSEWAFVLVNWALILSFNYLYHKYTVHSMGRSLGQRWFGLAVVREDGEPLQRMDLSLIHI